MTGNTLQEFMDDLFIAGGPEKEFLFRGKRYFLQCQTYEKDVSQIELVLFECFGDENDVFRCHGKNYASCVRKFEQAKIFDDMTIYEAEPEIEVIFG